jgi:jumonji domain-containing protein 7
MTALLLLLAVCSTVASLRANTAYTALLDTLPVHVEAVLVRVDVGGPPDNRALSLAARAFANERRLVLTAMATRVNVDDTSSWVLVRRASTRVKRCLSVPDAQVTVHGYNGIDVVEFVNGVLGWHWSPDGTELPRAEAVRSVLQRGAQSAVRQCHVTDDAPTEQRVFDAIVDSQPTVFRGAARHWPARQLWTEARLRAVGGASEVFVKATGANGSFEGVELASMWPAQGDVPTSVSSHLRWPWLVTARAADVKLRLDEFFDILHQEPNGTSFYLEYTAMSQLPLLASGVPNELRPFEFARFLEQSHLNVWIGDGRTTGRLHFDEFENLLAQLSGRKVFKLIHANERAFEGHIREVQWEHHRNRVPDMTRTQLLQSTSITMAPFDLASPMNASWITDAQVFSCTVDAGDVLLLPAFTWHEVESFPDTRRDERDWWIAAECGGERVVRADSNERVSL